MTFGYGRTDPPYGTAANPYHRGDDWYMPDGTPIVVNGVQIGISGHSGFVTGPHCHIGKWLGGKDLNPNSQGWQLENPQVTDIGYDATNGNYVGLQDSRGYRWVYLHMQVKSTNVKVGDYLDTLPKYGESEEPMFNDGDRKNWLAEAYVQDIGQYSDLVGKVTYKEAIEKMRTDGLLRTNQGDVINGFAIFGAKPSPDDLGVWTKQPFKKFQYEKIADGVAKMPPKGLKPYDGPQLLIKS